MHSLSWNLIYTLRVVMPLQYALSAATLPLSSLLSETESTPVSVMHNHICYTGAIEQTLLRFSIFKLSLMWIVQFGTPGCAETGTFCYNPSMTTGAVFQAVSWHWPHTSCASPGVEWSLNTTQGHWGWLSGSNIRINRVHNNGHSHNGGEPWPSHCLWSAFNLDSWHPGHHQPLDIF